MSTPAGRAAAGLPGTWSESGTQLWECPNTTMAGTGSLSFSFFFFFNLNYVRSPAKGSPTVLGGQTALSRQAWETFGYILRWQLFTAGRCQGASTPISVDSQANLVPTPPNGFQMTENHRANLTPLPASPLGDCPTSYLSFPYLPSLPSTGFSLRAQKCSWTFPSLSRGNAAASRVFTLCRRNSLCPLALPLSSLCAWSALSRRWLQLPWRHSANTNREVTSHPVPALLETLAHASTCLISRL